LPAVVIGLYTRWFNPWALLIGWAAGTYAGTAMAVSVNFAAIYPLVIGSWIFPGYIALYTLILNLAISIVLTFVLNALGSKPVDQTVAADYHA
jgi:SSS family solute:Na+ symporter